MAAILGPARAAPAQTGAELSVTEALRARRSARSFADRPVDPALMAELLWAAFGINRAESGLHTAPSWRGVADVAVHLATAQGVLAYEPPNDTTFLRLAEDIRGALSPQPFVATAPACLILISDLRRLEPAGEVADRQAWARVNAAVVAENVYLFAAARGLGTCLVGGLDREAIVARLGLGADEYPTFVQPFGWPA